MLDFKTNNYFSEKPQEMSFLVFFNNWIDSGWTCLIYSGVDYRICSIPCNCYYRFGLLPWCLLPGRCVCLHGWTDVWRHCCHLWHLNIYHLPLLFNYLNSSYLFLTHCLVSQIRNYRLLLTQFVYRVYERRIYIFYKNAINIYVCKII